MSLTSVSTLVTAVATLGIAASLLVVVARMRATERMRLSYNEDLTQQQLARLEAVRRDLERQMYDLNSRLTSDPQRYRDVNHLVLEALSKAESTSAEGIDPRRFLHSLGVSDEEVRRRDTDLVAVLMPFHDTFSEVFQVVRDSAAEAGLRAERGDEKSAQGIVLKQIVSMIARSRLVVVLLDGRNPNVFYEMGIAQALGKPVLALTSEIDEVPFDIRNQRLLVFSSLAQLRSMLPRELARLLV